MTKILQSRARFIQIDSLRGIAAVVVMLHHFIAIYDRDFKHSFFVPPVFNYGFYGVELFFIISGFVIYQSIQFSRSAKDFLLKRAIRLYPAYLLCALLTFLVVHFFPLNEFRNTSVQELVINLTMLNGLFKVKAVDPSYWSLLVELFFYLMIAMLLITKLSRYIYLFLSLWLLLLLFYNTLYKVPGLGAFFNLRYGSLFISGICFYKIRIENDRSNNIFLLLSLIFVFSLFVLRDLDFSSIAIPVIYAIFIIGIFLDFRLLQNSVLVFFGSISYPLYLIHQNIGFVIINEIRKAGLTQPILLIFPIAISVLTAWLIAAYYEKVAIKFLHSIFFRRVQK